jgi:hypothetical protein
MSKTLKAEKVECTNLGDLQIFTNYGIFTMHLNQASLTDRTEIKYTKITNPYGDLIFLKSNYTSESPKTYKEMTLEGEIFKVVKTESVDEEIICYLLGSVRSIRSTNTNSKFIIADAIWGLEEIIEDLI